MDLPLYKYIASAHDRHPIISYGNIVVCLFITSFLMEMSIVFLVPREMVVYVFDRELFVVHYTDAMRRVCYVGFLYEFELKPI